MGVVSKCSILGMKLAPYKRCNLWPYCVLCFSLGCRAKAIVKVIRRNSNVFTSRRFSAERAQHQVSLTVRMNH
jgi:hypothetical protein